MKRSTKKNFRIFIFGLIIGMAIMYFLDMVFHFNNSVDTAVKREIDKAVNKVENIFK